MAAGKRTWRQDSKTGKLVEVTETVSARRRDTIRTAIDRDFDLIAKVHDARRKKKRLEEQRARP